MTTTALMDMFASSLRARWEGKASLFGPVEAGKVRMHFYREGSKESACGNHPRNLIACLTWSVDQVACHRCTEALTWAGEPIPSMPEPPKADDFEGDDIDALVADVRTDLEVALRDIDRAYDACRAAGGDDTELRTRRDELIAALAQLDVEAS